MGEYKLRIRKKINRIEKEINRAATKKDVDKLRFLNGKKFGYEGALKVLEELEG